MAGHWSNIRDWLKIVHSEGIGAVIFGHCSPPLPSQGQAPKMKIHEALGLIYEGLVIKLGRN